jgi:hypothetical protein
MSNEIALMREIAKLQEQIDALRTIEVGGVWQSWTPEAIGLTSPSYATQTGKYTVIGNLIIGHFRLLINSWTAQSGTVRIVPPPVGTFLIGTGGYYNQTYPRLYARRIEKYFGYIIFMNEDSSGSELWTATSLVELKGNFIGEI